MDRDDGGPAFPVETRREGDELGHQTGNTIWQFPGMTIRDYFAAKAMQTYLENRDVADMRDMASAAYAMADAMLKERSKP